MESNAVVKSNPAQSESQALFSSSQRLLQRMVRAIRWYEWFESPPHKSIRLIVEDLKKSGISAETAQKAGLIPLTYFLMQLEEPKARAFIKELLNLPSSVIGGQDLLKSVVLLGFPYFDGSNNLLFLRVRSSPPLRLKDDDGREREAKYLQPTKTPALPYIPQEVWALASKPNKPLWITEGEKKALKLLQHGRHSIALSGVWNFRAGEETARGKADLYLWQELQEFVWTGRTVFLGFDMDMWSNPQVRMALFELALKLYAKGAVVKIPQWKGAKGIDDYLALQPDVEKALEELEEKATNWYELARVEDTDAIVRALSLTELDSIRHEQMYRTLAKKLQIKPETLQKAVWKRLEESQKGGAEFTEEELNTAKEILKGNILDRLLADIKKLYAGREKEKLLLYLVVQSRKVLNLPLNLMVILRGDSSEGKSSLVRSILSLIHEDDFLEISYQSRTYLYYGVKDLSHKVLFLTELDGSTKGLYAVKLALTEGELLIRSVEATKNGLKPINRRIPAYSMPVITTGVNPIIDEEMATRSIVLSLSSDDDLRYEALKVKTLIPPEEKARIKRLWRAVDGILEKAEVVIPYIDKIVECMRGRLVAGRYLRDFDKFIGLLMASALIHQHQRERDEKGRIIASKEDYEVAYSLQELFTETFGGLPQNIDLVMKTLLELKQEKEESGDQEKEVYMHELMARLMEKTGKKDRTVRSWIARAKQLKLLGQVNRGRQGHVVYPLTDELPEPELPFPSPEEVFMRELPDCHKTGKALQDNNLNVATCNFPQLPHLPEKEKRQDKNMEIWQTLQNGGCHISSVENQGSDGNVAKWQSPTINDNGQDTPSTHEENGQPSPNDFFIALEAELKRLKKQAGHRGIYFTSYPNYLQRTWELINGVQTILKIHIANGLTIEEAVNMLRQAFEQTLKPSPLNDLDDLPF